MASVGALVIEMSADVASIKRDMDKAVSVLNSSQAQMNRALSSISGGFINLAKVAGVALGARAVYSHIKSQIELGDQLSKTSQKLGASVESLSAYQYGAKLSGVETNELNGSLAKLARNMQESVITPGGAAAETFRALGISVTDANGKLRSTDAVFDDIGKRFASAPDGPEKTAAAMKLLGKTGGDLIPLLNNLQTLTDEAQRTGNVISTDFAKQSEQFNDTLTRMGSSLGIFTRKMLSEVVPAINHWIERLNVATGAQARLSLQSLEDLLRSKQKRLEELGKEIGRSFVIGDVEKTGLGRERAALNAEVQEIQQQIALQKKSTADLQASRNDASKLNPIRGPGQINADRFGDMQRALRLATEKANAELVQGEANRVEAEIKLAKDAMREKIQFSKLTADQQKRIQDDLAAYDAAITASVMKKNQGAFKDLLDEWKDTSKLMQDASARWLDSSANALTEFVMTGKLEFQSLAKSIISDLVRIQIQKALTNAADSVGGGFGSFFRGLLGYADGGDPAVGKAAIVGERGPELFVPKVAGTIVPNDELGMGGGNRYNISVSVDARGTSVSGDEESSNDLARKIGNAVRNILVDEKRPGGLLA